MDIWMCLVTSETFDCLLRSQVPTLRLKDRERFLDRYLVLMSPMLSHFYDIAAIDLTILPYQTIQATYKVE